MSAKEKPKTLVTISELKQIYKKDTSYNDRLQSLKEKLDNLIRIEDWEVQEILPECNYSQPEVVDCIIYYTTGSSLNFTRNL